MPNLQRLLSTITILIVCLIISGCQTVLPRPDLAPATQESYPMVTRVSNAYPNQDTQTSDSNTSSSLIFANPTPADLQPFLLKTPILPGSTRVYGSGPAGVPIALLNITKMGQLLGETVIGSDGNFVFSVQPLSNGIQIGVTLGNLSGTNLSREHFNNSGYYGPNAMQIPQVGFFFDTAIVKLP